MEVRVDLLPEGSRTKAPSDPAQLGFSKYFASRMLSASWTEGKGWHDPRIGAYAPLVLEPSAAVFHYGQEIFEGLKASRRPDGSVYLFRPEMNQARFNQSAARLALPELPAELFLEGIEELVRLERDWIPRAEGTSLYIRPTLIGVEEETSTC